MMEGVIRELIDSDTSFTSPSISNVEQELQPTSLPQADHLLVERPLFEETTLVNEETTNLSNSIAPRLRLADLLNQTSVPPIPVLQNQRTMKRKRSFSPPLIDKSRDDQLRALLAPSQAEASTSQKSSNANTSSPEQPLSEYQCPICFCPPTRATLTLCGHVLCGPCLFGAVKAARERYVRLYGRGTGPDGEGKVARCPVCRSIMKGWDGRGGGVVGLRLELEK